jgi:serine/threonine protein kinase
LTGPDGHSLGIVHRDVTPSNVMCLREGGVKLLDFGIASAVSDDAVEQTDQGAFKGKLAYMAPERLRNEPLDGRSDLYSLGVMLWEMLTCRRLFRGASDAETFRNVLEMRVPAPSTQRQDIRPSLDAIVLRMLERDRSKRYQTGKAVADDLDDVLRECNFRSRTVPALLSELFGSSIHSSQIALSCLTPELLASPEETGSHSTTSIVSHRHGWAWLLAVAAVAATLTWGLFAGWFAHHPTERQRVVHEAPPVPTAAQPQAAVPVQPTPPEPTSKPPAAGVAEVAPPAPPRKARRAHGRRAARAPAARFDEDAIAKGRSIDPFAEAAKRGRR